MNTWSRAKRRTQSCEPRVKDDETATQCKKGLRDRRKHTSENDFRIESENE